MKTVHPGEILREEFLEPMGISQYRLAQGIVVAPRRINEIVHGNRAITADTAIRLSRFFGTSERFWINLQAQYDLDTQKDKIGTTLDGLVGRALGGRRKPEEFVALRTSESAKDVTNSEARPHKHTSRSSRTARKAR